MKVSVEVSVETRLYKVASSSTVENENDQD